MGVERFQWMVGENLCTDPEICSGCGGSIGYMEIATLYEDMEGEFSEVYCLACATQVEENMTDSA